MSVPRERQIGREWEHYGVARAADRIDHHPDWSNAHNKVTVDLSTHSAGRLTRKDFELAGRIQTIYGQ
jgi:4a-hydroxytetrahydrobiopterin dehydratase